MTYLITGGAGFIGSNLCLHFINQGHEVIIIDDLSAGRMSNLNDSEDGIIFFKEKIENFDFKKIKNVHAVIHLAAQASVPLSIVDFHNSSSSNLLGTISIIDFCSKNNIPLIYASSSAIYGDLKMGDDKKDYIDLISPYATDKFVMELYAMTAFKNYQLSSIGLRFFNVYGPRQDPSSPYSGVISIFSERILNRENIVINGGYQTRDFIYVNDVIAVICRAIELVSKKTVCDISNVLTGKSVTIDYLADQLMEVIGIKVNKIYEDLSLEDPKKSDGTVENMSKLLLTDIGQFTKFKKGLEETVQYIKNKELNL
jgi:UDP-glucose 4-epimerase